MAQPSNELFSAIETRQWDRVIQIVKLDPEVAEREAPHSENLALHEVCKNQPPLEVIEVMHKANRDAVRSKGQWGYLPLHYACTSAASYEVVKKLIDSFQGSTRSRDNEQCLPLHLACKWGAKEDVLMALLTTYPESIYIRESSGKTPLAMAKTIEEPSTRDIVVKVLKQGPTLCAVSKAAFFRITEENNLKNKYIQEAHTANIHGLTSRYKDQIKELKEVQRSLIKEIQDEKEIKACLAENINVEKEKVFNLEKQIVSMNEEYKISYSEYENKINGLMENLMAEKQKSNSLERELKLGKDTLKSNNEKMELMERDIKLAEERNVEKHVEKIEDESDVSLEMGPSEELSQKGELVYTNLLEELEMTKKKLQKTTRLVEIERQKFLGQLRMLEAQFKAERAKNDKQEKENQTSLIRLKEELSITRKKLEENSSSFEKERQEYTEKVAALESQCAAEKEKLRKIKKQTTSEKEELKEANERIDVYLNTLERERKEFAIGIFSLEEKLSSTKDKLKQYEEKEKPFSQSQFVNLSGIFQK